MSVHADELPRWSQVATSGIALVGECSPELAALLRRARYRMPHATARTTDPIAALGEIVRLAVRTLPAGDPRWRALGDVLCVCADPYCYADQYRPDAGVAYLEQALHVFRDHAGLAETNSRFALVNQMLGEALFWARRYPEGAELAERTRRTLESSLPTDHWYPSLFQALLGAHQRHCGDAKTALVNLEAGLSRLQAVTGFGFGSSLHGLVLRELLELLQETGAEVAAERWSRVLAKLLALRGRPTALRELVLRPRFDDIFTSLQHLESVAADPAAAGPLIGELLQACRERMADEPERRAVAVRWLANCVQQYAIGLQRREGTQQLAHDVAIPALEALLESDLATDQTRFTAGQCLSTTLLHYGDAARARDTVRRWRAMLASDGVVAGQRAIAQSLVGWVELQAASNEAERAEARNDLRRGYEDRRFGALDSGTNVAFQRLMDAFHRAGRTADVLPLWRERMQVLLDSDAGAGYLNLASWCIARIPGLEAGDYELALAGIREAVRISPGHWAYENTLGAALHRAGFDRQAIDALQRADSIRRDSGQAPSPADWGFLALAHQRLGDSTAATQAMARFEEAMREPANAGDPENQDLAREAKLAFGQH
jgi:tetratricopeptide (TPR) repeat protein